MHLAKTAWCFGWLMGGAAISTLILRAFGVSVEFSEMLIYFLVASVAQLEAKSR